MSTTPEGPAGFADRMSRNDAALDRYRDERADRHARGATTRTSDRVIARMEVEKTLLQAWADREARAAAR
jgi:hypothetical protein